MSDDDPKPVGELGAAFASLTDDMPEADFTAWTVIGEARRRRSRRRTLTIGIAAAAAGIAVLTPVIISISQNAGSTTSSSALAPSASRSSSAAASASSSAATSAAASSAAGGSAPAAAGGSAPAPEKSPDLNPADAGSGSTGGADTAGAGTPTDALSSAASTLATAAAAGCTTPGLSLAQDTLVQNYLTGYRVADQLCATDLTTDVVGARVYTANGSASVPQVSVTISDGPVSFCPDPAQGTELPDARCADLAGHPGVRSANTATGTVVVASDANGAVVVSIQLGDPPIDAPFTAGDLADLATALASTL